MYHLDQDTDYEYLRWLITHRKKKRVGLTIMELVRMIYNAHLVGSIDGNDRDILIIKLCGGIPWARKEKPNERR